MQEQDTEGGSKWQPAMVVLRGGGRLECRCGALAVIVIGRVNKDADNQLEEVDYWCRECYVEAQREEMQDADTPDQRRWQPIMMVLSDSFRIECGCGALATFITASVADEAASDGTREYTTFEGWCRSCFQQQEAHQSQREDR